MNGDPELPDHQHEENEEGVSDPGEPVEAGTVFRGSVPSLDAFAGIHPSLASIDFTAIQAAQRAFEQAGAFKKIIEAQEAIAKDFARSIDFSGLAATHKAIVDAGGATQAMAAQKQWGEYLDTRGLSIAGGTLKIQRNNLSERGRGSPRPIRTSHSRTSQRTDVVPDQRKGAVR